MDATMLTRRKFLVGSSSLIAGHLWTSAAFANSEASTLINVIRRDNGLSSLAESTQLTRMAQYQSNLMAEHQKLSHSVTWSDGFVARLRKFEIHGPAAENIGAGQHDISSVYQAWMRSSGHRRNMLDPTFGHFGIAKASASQKPQYYYWTIVFGL